MDLINSHCKSTYTELQNNLRPSFKLKEGWEYILSTIATNYQTSDLTTENVQYCKEILSSNPFPNPFFASGGGRDVYVLPPTAHTSPHHHIIKFPKSTQHDQSLTGINQNRHETHLWKETTDNTLLPISAYHNEFKWVIMPLGKPHQEIDIETAEIESFLDEAYTQLETQLDPTEFKPHNVIMLNSDLYMCDYGYTNEFY